MNRRNFFSKLSSIAGISSGAAAFFAAYNIFTENEKFYDSFVMPIAHSLSPETAHEVAVFVGKYNLYPKTRFADPEILKTDFLGMELPNPLGMAAGFDKHGECVKGLHNIGFGFVEVGSVTPLPQDGNPKPRVFRLPEDKAVINRYGFNSDGHAAVVARLKKLRNDEDFKGITGVNLGKNKESADPVDDFVRGIKEFGSVADYLVINISSPNTPGLRTMQDKEILKDLIAAAVSARDSLPGKAPPILIKLSPDLTSKERMEIAEVLRDPRYKVDGLIIANTTVAAGDLLNSEYGSEVGGLSGAPLRDKSTRMIRDMYTLTNKRIPIVGVGGVFTGKDAYEKILAGASVVQVYTCYVYHGQPRIRGIKRELSALLERDGYRSVKEAVGKEATQSVSREEDNVREFVASANFS